MLSPVRLRANQVPLGCGFQESLLNCRPQRSAFVLHFWPPFVRLLPTGHLRAYSYHYRSPYMSGSQQIAIHD